MFFALLFVFLLYSLKPKINLDKKNTHTITDSCDLHASLSTSNGNI